jgi:hypothetical protein
MPRNLTNTEYNWCAAQIAADQMMVMGYVLGSNPEDFAAHVKGSTQKTARYAALADFDRHLPELAKVVSWVLFVMDYHSQTGYVTKYERRIWRAAQRLDGVFQLIEKREGKLLTEQQERKR